MTFAPLIAAPLTKGSAATPGVSAAGRRQEDDVNLVATTAALAVNLRGREEGARPEIDTLASVRAASGGSSRSYLLTSSAAGSLAKTSALPASEQASKVSAPVSSLSSQGSQMSLSQDGLSLKTSLGFSPLPRAETLEFFSQRWPKSGMAAPGGWLTLDTLEFPSGAVECSLSDVLEMTVSERYALSARAARGILRRASVRGRALPKELLEALEALAA